MNKEFLIFFFFSLAALNIEIIAPYLPTLKSAPPVSFRLLFPPSCPRLLSLPCARCGRVSVPGSVSCFCCESDDDHCTADVGPLHRNGVSTFTFYLSLLLLFTLCFFFFFSPFCSSLLILASACVTVNVHCVTVPHQGPQR